MQSLAFTYINAVIYLNHDFLQLYLPQPLLYYVNSINSRMEIGLTQRNQQWVVSDGSSHFSADNLFNWPGADGVSEDFVGDGKICVSSCIFYLFFIIQPTVTLDSVSCSRTFHFMYLFLGKHVIMNISVKVPVFRSWLIFSCGSLARTCEHSGMLKLQTVNKILLMRQTGYADRQQLSSMIAIHNVLSPCKQQTMSQQ